MKTFKKTRLPIGLRAQAAKEHAILKDNLVKLEGALGGAARQGSCRSGNLAGVCLLGRTTSMQNLADYLYGAPDPALTVRVLAAFKRAAGVFRSRMTDPQADRRTRRYAENEMARLELLRILVEEGLDEFRRQVIARRVAVALKYGHP